MTRKLLPMDAAAVEEGRKAAEEGKHFNDHCPYLFGRLGVTKDEFESTYRAKLNGWFDGWQGWLRERGLGNDFKPFGLSRGAWTEKRRKAQGKKS